MDVLAKHQSIREPIRVGLYRRLATFAVDEFLPLIGTPDKLAAHGATFKVTSSRLLTYKVKGVCCVDCGLRGQYFALETGWTGPEDWHINFYAVKGGEVMMTRDHIVPKAWGGADTVENSQPMCSPCNGRKGDKFAGSNKNRIKMQRPPKPAEAKGTLVHPDLVAGANPTSGSI
jgi:hypothetical protein